MSKRNKQSVEEVRMIQAIARGASHDEVVAVVLGTSLAEVRRGKAQAEADMRWLAAFGDDDF